MAQSQFRRVAFEAGAVSLAVLSWACSTRQSEHADHGDEAVATAALPVFVNGDFETGTAGAAPPDWTVTPYLNPSITYPPVTRTDLRLAAGGTALTYTLVAAGGPESEPDANMGNGATLRWPKYGSKVAVVNLNGSGTNVNSLKQTMKIAAGDFDPLDGKAHIRFVLAPVLENPDHPAAEQPYYWVQLTNVTQTKMLYQDFNRSAMPGVPWKEITRGGRVYQYTDWQLVDVAPGNASLALGDDVELEVIASRCSRTGHRGYVYLDSVASTIPGLYVTATGPNAQNAGSNITYTLSYRNGGTGAAAGVMIDFNTPANTTWVGYTAPGVTCAAPAVGATGLASCTIGSVSPGSGGTFQVTVKINDAATGTITNGNYSIYATGITPLLGPKVFTNITSGISYADLAITKGNGVAGVAWGTPVAYTIVARNNGPSAVTGVTVADAIPAQLTGATWTCAGAGGGVCPASGIGPISATVDLPVNATATFTLNANVVAGSGSGSVSNTASLTLPALASDTDPTNNSAVDTDAIGELRTLSVTKAGNGLGTVSSAPAAINCGTSCTGSFVQGTSVVLNAVASSGDAFASWGGDCSGTTPSCTIVVSANSSVTATFNALPKPNGASCADGSGCTSTNCIDGVCCDTPCGAGVTTDCQACNIAGSEGTCSNVAAGATCRPSAGDCDVAEACSGTSADCPLPDTFVPNTTQCRTAVGDCDVAEYCTGSAAGCPPDAVATSTTTCRTADGDCDVTEYCDGSTKACPADAVATNAITCRGAAGICDVAELCDGTDKACPTDLYAGATVVCRAATCIGGTATLAASCTGSDASCPAISTVACGTFMCGASACLGICATNSDCVAGNYCAAGACVPKVAQGGACDRNDMCSSGFCADQVCCDAVCDGQCEACDIAGSIGACTAVPAGAPHGTRTACATDSSVCGGTCDGTVRTSCTYPGSSLQCRAPSCDAGTATLAANCNGAGACPALQTQSCTPFQCGTTQCLGECTLDQDCIATDYCSAGLCIDKLAAGVACTANNQCTSGNCVDGVCCNTSCTEQCEACNVAGFLGTCSPVTGAPHGSRPVCASDGTICVGACDGSNRSACHYPAGEQVCRSAACSSGVATVEAHCDGAGACPDIQTQACTPYLCGATSCAGNCTVDTDCLTTHFCSAGVCVQKLSSGSDCGGDNQCASSHCVDGVCCDTACTGQCEACDVPGTLGTCSPVAGAPHAARVACSSDGSQCAGACDGTARDVCVYPGSAVSCRAASCADGVATLAATCDGQGACPAIAQQQCGTFTCGATACQGDCTADAQCVAGNYCSAGACTTKRLAGQTCDGANQCATGFCVDGVCCDAACQGQCQACDVTGVLGTCSPVSGMPHGSRPGCSGLGNCVGVCDGTKSEACTYPGSATICSSASCSNGIAYAAAVCDGNGSCGANAESSCGAYPCVGQTCGSSCTTNIACAAGNICVGGACVAGTSGTGGTGGVIGAAGNAGTTSTGTDVTAAGSGGVGTGGVGTGGTVEIGGATSTGGQSEVLASSTMAKPGESASLEGGGCACRAAQSGNGNRGAIGALMLALALGANRLRRRTGRECARHH